MRKLAQIFGTLMTFLTSIGFTYLGVLGAAVLIWLLAAKTLGWVGWILIGYFICHNMQMIRPWALKQWRDIKRKF